MRGSFLKTALLAFLAATGAWAQSVNGTTGNFPFPQNLNNPYGFHSSIYNNADVLAAYNRWYTDCVTSTGAGGFLRVQRPNEPGLNHDSTVSEGIGYGMVIAVYMNDENLFDNLWKYEQLHLDGSGLMNWYIDASGANDGTGGATDGDEDMAWGLLMAARQWGGNGSLGTSYQSLAVSQINKLYTYISANGMIPDGGDGFTPINPSYFDPAYYREFAAASGQAGWLTVAANCYTVLNGNLSQGYGNASNGLDSAWCTSAGVSTNTNSAPWDYQYDACRTPFRIIQDYLWFGNGSSQAYATKTSSFFSAIGAVSIVDGYFLNGNPDPQSPVLPNGPSPVSQSAAFVGPAGCGAMVSRNYQQYIDDTYSNLVGSKLLQGGFYYDESWTVMSLLMLSDNFLDYNLYTTPTPTPTLSAYSPQTIRVNCGGPQFVDSQPATWAADQQFTAGSWGYDATNTGSTSTYTSTVTGTSFNQQTLYQTERWGNPTYHFTLPNGYYQILFKFCENYDPDSHTGGRVFSVSAAGAPVISNLDVYTFAGGEHKAYDVPVTAVVTTGQLDIVFSSTADTSQVNAMQVIRLTTPPTPTATVPWTVTPTNTPKGSTSTPTGTPTSTSVSSFTGTPSATPSSTLTATASLTPTFSPTLTASWTTTATPSSTTTASPSFTTSPTATLSATATPSLTSTKTLTSTATGTGTLTPVPSNTPTSTASLTPSPTVTYSPTLIPTYSPTGTPSSTPTRTATFTATASPTASTTKTLTSTSTGTPSGTPTKTATSTATSTGTLTPIPTNTPSASPTQSTTKTPTFSPTSTFSPTLTLTPTRTPIASATSTLMATETSTVSATPSLTLTPFIVSTSTPSPSQIVLQLPFPNPSYGAPILLSLEAPGGSTANWDVFTTAFRKVASGSLGPNGIEWDLKDKNGAQVSSGLYYLRVVARDGHETVTKLFKLLVLR